MTIERFPGTKEVTRAITYDELGNVLLGLRARGYGANQWALLGGKPDQGESLEDCVRRELKEEAGGDFNPEFYMHRLDVSSTPNDPWNVYYFTGRYIGELRLKADEIKEARFVGPEELEQLDMAFDHREVLTDYFKSRRLSQ